MSPEGVPAPSSSYHCFAKFEKSGDPVIRLIVGWFFRYREREKDCLWIDHKLLLLNVGVSRLCPSLEATLFTDFLRLTASLEGT
jgi:hypothetical protein